MKISFLINSHNESAHLRATIADIDCDMQKNGFTVDKDYETIVYADGALETGQQEHVKILYSENPIGCGKAKVELTKAAAGDVLVYLDAHHALHHGSYCDLAATAIERQAIVHPLIYCIRYDAAGKPFFHHENASIPSPYLSLGTNHESFLHRTDEGIWGQWVGKISTHLGNCVAPYIIPRLVMERLGGWNAFPYRHGAQEIGMALRAAFADVDRVVDGRVGVGHAFRSGGLRFSGVKAWHQDVNYIYAWMVGLHDQEFDGWLRPKLIAFTKSPKQYEEHIAAIRADKTFRRQQEQLISLRRNVPALLDKSCFNGWSLTFETWNWIIQTIPKGSGVLELGSGRISESLSRRFRLSSIEHKPDFVGKYHDPRHYVHAPLSGDWYDASKIPQIKTDYELLLIDGPPATQADRSKIIGNWRLFGNPRWVLIDDAHRESSRRIAEYLITRENYLQHVELTHGKRSVVLRRRDGVERAKQLETAG